MKFIYPAVMGLDDQALQKIKLLKNVDRIHIDIMDNIFVPNITHGLDHINEQFKKIDFFPWLHLMVQNPLPFYQRLIVPEHALVSFHIESSVDICEMIKTIKEKKHMPSIAISPKTDLGEIFPFVQYVSQVLVMSVEPGFSGQPFLKSVIKKIEELVLYREQNKYDFRIGVDGGVNKDNIGLLSKMGVDDFAISSGIFSEENPVIALQELYKLIGRF